MNFLIVEMLKVSSVLWIFLYGSLYIASELFSSALPIGLCAIAVMPICLSFIRIKPPNLKAVEAVIGKDPMYLSEEENEKNCYVMKTVGHRGAALDAPENSLIAFKMCAEKGCDAVEFDVTLTADNIPVVFHDDSLERLTDSLKEIRQMTWAELSHVDISVKHPLREKFKDTRIARLEETIIQCLEDKQRMFIDIKERDMHIVTIILDLYKKYPQLHQNAVCTSFFPNVIYMIRRANPNIVCSLAWRPYLFSYDSFSSILGKGRPRSTVWFIRLFHSLLDILFDWAIPQILYYVLGISIILLNKEAISGEVIYGWRCKGIRVMAWTVNHPIEKQHFSRNFKITYFTDTLIGETSAHLSVRK